MIPPIKTFDWTSSRTFCTFEYGLLSYGRDSSNSGLAVPSDQQHREFQSFRGRDAGRSRRAGRAGHRVRRVPGVPDRSGHQEVVLRASQVPHAAALGNLRMQIGEGITGWVAEHKSVVALSSNAARDAAVQALPGAGGRHLRSFALGAAGERRRPGRSDQRSAPASRTSTATTRSAPWCSSANSSAWPSPSPAGGGERPPAGGDPGNARELETRKLVERAKGILQQQTPHHRRRRLSPPAQSEPPAAPAHERTGRSDSAGGGSGATDRGHGVVAGFRSLRNFGKLG